MHDWDATTYAKIAAPQHAWALPVIERLSLCGDEAVLDAGCGSGGVTAELLERLPRGRVVAVDASPAMIEQARALLMPRFAGRLELRCRDLIELDVDAEVDAVFSGAVFHWILDHCRLFAHLHRALRAGGRLAAQCGGAGNLDRVQSWLAHAIDRLGFAPRFADWSSPWRFATAEETAGLLAEAGFSGIACRLTPKPTRFADAASFAEFVRVVVLGQHLARLADDAERGRLLAAVVEQAARADPPWLLDYVRLDMDARRAAG